MADDNSYMSFLEKANQPLTGYSTASKIETPAEKKLKTLDAGLAVPKAIQSALDKEPVFVSDADELFEGVSLKWDKDELPTAEVFATLIDHPMPLSAEILVSDVQEWDPNNQYAEVVDAVKQATNDGELKVYAVARTQVKTEYWVVGVDKGEKRIVGAKALGVES